MATTYPAHPTDHPTEAQVVHSSQALLRIAYGVVPVVAGVDKFMNRLANWEDYLNPAIPSMLHLSAFTFMRGVGVIEMLAGALLLAKPRLGGFVVMAWLFAISLQLIFWGRYLDIAVRDLTMALGALTLARLSPFARAAEDEGWKS